VSGGGDGWSARRVELRMGGTREGLAELTIGVGDGRRRQTAHNWGIGVGLLLESTPLISPGHRHDANAGSGPAGDGLRGHFDPQFFLQVGSKLE
jgi:hypothetical protein